MEFSAFSLVAIILATAVDSVLGALWYSPTLFGNKFMALIGIQDPKELKGAGVAMAMSMIASLIMVMSIFWLYKMVGLTSVRTGLGYSLLIGIGIIATQVLPPYLYEDRPRKLYWIYVGYKIISVLIVGLILSIWVVRGW